MQELIVLLKHFILNSPASQTEHEIQVSRLQTIVKHYEEKNKAQEEKNGKLEEKIELLEKKIKLLEETNGGK